MLISFVVLFSFIMNFQGLWLTLIYRPTTKGKTGGNEKAIGIDQQGAWSTFLLISPHNQKPCVKVAASDFISSQHLKI